MFPPKRQSYYLNRLNIQAELPWEPWLFCGVWFGVLFTVIFGEAGLVPPFDFIDSFWVMFGLISPPIGFFSLWALDNLHGKAKYIAIWTRMSADIGLSACILIYLAVRGRATEYDFHYLGDVMLAFCAWFALVLVKRDIDFLVTTEKLASIIYQRNVDEWNESGC